MSLWQGVKGAQVELAAITSPVKKLQTFGRIARLFASELAGTISLAPFASRALSLYRSTPALDSLTQPPAGAHELQPVYVVKDVRYGEAPRNTLDIWLPGEAAASAAAAAASGSAGDAIGQPQLPVVVFVHGGVWAAGEKWHYAPLAACLARLGVVACVVSYTLFPDALVPQAVAEVAAAFDWVAANGGRYGGDVRQLSLVGHSAGAQLCMMALLQRAQAAHDASSSSNSSNGSNGADQQQQQQPLVMPAQFVAVTGVYDIARHYSYEKQRGVHELSTMKRAMGGFTHFAANSPSVILGATLQQQWEETADAKQQQREQEGSGAEPAACSFYDSFQLSGEAIAHRIGFDRGSGHHLAAEAGLQLQSTAGMAGVMRFDLAAAAFLPPTVLLSSCTDITVPWYESAEMYWRLLDCGVPVKHLVYNKVGHGDFVVDWPSRSSGASDDWGGQPLAAAASDGAGAAADTADAADDWGSSSSNSAAGGAGSRAVAAAAGGSSSSSSRRSREQQQLLEELPPYCRDIAVLVMRQQPVAFAHRPLAAAAGGALVEPADAVGAAVDARVLVQPAELN